MFLVCCKQSKIGGSAGIRTLTLRIKSPIRLPLRHGPIELKLVPVDGFEPPLDSNRLSFFAIRRYRHCKQKHAPATSVYCPRCFRGVLEWKVSNLRAKWYPRQDLNLQALRQ